MKKLFISAITFMLFCNASMAQPGGMFPGSSCTPDSSYHFKGMIKMDMTVNIKNSDTNPMAITMYISAATNSYASIIDQNIGPARVNITTITRLRDSQIVMMMDMGEMKTISCNSLKDFSGSKKIKNDFVAPPMDKVKKTGRSKTILGYTCNEFQYDSADLSLTMWIAPELKDMSFANNGVGTQVPANMQGLAMEFTMQDRSKNYFVHSVVSKIDKEISKDISTDGYTYH